MQQQAFASPEEALVHFGKKGMKWGVRKNHAQDVLTKAERQAAKSHMKVEGRVVKDRVIDSMFGGKHSLAETPYSKLSTKRQVVNPGTEFHRVTGRKNEQVRDITFVSTNEVDRNRYNAILPSLTGKGGKKSYKQHYEHTFEVTKKLSLPSEKDRIDAFNELLTTPSIQVGKKTLTGQQYLKTLGYGKKVDNVHTAKFGQAAFNRTITQQHLNQPMSSAYFKRLRDKGFNAVQDDNDKLVMAKDPLILLDPHGTVKRTHIKPLSNRDINDAQRRFSSNLDD